MIEVGELLIAVAPIGPLRGGCATSASRAGRTAVLGLAAPAAFFGMLL